MTTVSSTSSSSTSSASIAQTLGAGSGIDIKNLVSSLVDAQFAVKNKQLSRQSDAISAQISSVAKLKAGITGFSDALKGLVKGGSLTTQPTSSNTGVATVSLLTGGSAAGLSAQLSVQQLAGAQAATSSSAVGTTQPFLGGSLTVKIGSYVTADDGTRSLSATKTVPITIADGATIDQIAAQIKSETGLQTTLINDGSGVRLSIKGATGAAQAFEIAGVDTGSAASGRSLSTLAVGPGATGMTIGTQAKDAQLTLDGASFSRASNSISDLLPGVKLELTGTTASGATPVALGASTPGSALVAAVDDVVATFNEIKKMVAAETNSVDGALRTDTAAAALNRALGQLTTKVLVNSTTGGPRTLADLGVSTNKDGTLSLDTARLTKVMLADPAGVEAMFAMDASGKGGLSEAITTIATNASDKNYGFDAATTRYQAAAKLIAKQQSTATDAATAATTRMTQQYAAMDARVAAYKASQSFIEQQVKVWTKSD